MSQYLRSDTGIFAAIRRAGSAALPAPYAHVGECAKQISRFNKFRLDPKNLAFPSALPDLSAQEPPRIEYEGGNLASTLYYMEETEDPALDKIRVALRNALPAFKNFDFNVIGTQRIGMSIQFDDQRQTIPAARLSDGQLLLVGLVTLVHAPNRPPVLMLEEPENGLTATAQRAFYQAVRGLAFPANPADRSQVLISSHSPFILCEAWNGEDREFIHQVKVENGQACVRRFSEAVSAQHIQLRKEAGTRTTLGLANAEQLMSGYLS